MTKDEQVREAVKIDLADARDALQSLFNNLAKMSQADRIDAAARCNAMAKVLKDIDEAVKDEVKTKLGEKPGMVNGHMFRASMGVSPVTRLNEGKLKKEQPKIHAKYCETNPQRRVTYEVR